LNLVICSENGQRTSFLKARRVMMADLPGRFGKFKAVGKMLPLYGSVAY
jgi:hypothetical protein